jgi:hypothetical protein
VVSGLQLAQRKQRRELSLTQKLRLARRLWLQPLQ